jgi:hypothetical protein
MATCGRAQALASALEVPVHCVDEPPLADAEELANDLNHDGDLLDPGEGLARWASNGTLGSEFTGLYFDPCNKRRAWVNIQHPSSSNDRTIEISIPRGSGDDGGDCGSANDQ